NPRGPLIVDVQGNVYGTADDVVFKLSPNPERKYWTETVLHQFCSDGCGDGSLPVAGLTYAGASSGAPYDGVSPVYGTTLEGGSENAGTVFELTNSNGTWNETVLYSFCSVGGDQCLDGSGPAGGVVLDGAGNLYGTTNTGGGHDDGNIAGGSGTIFELSIGSRGSWTETVLHSFCSEAECDDGAFPVDNLTRDADGSLLGTTTGGGGPCKADPIGCGTIYRVIPTGINSQETVLYNFCAERDCRDGHGPLSGVFVDSSGNLFGTTSYGGGNDIDRLGIGGGVVYELSGSSLTILHHFCSLQNCADGEYPQRAAVVTDGLGHFYGVTNIGGLF